MIQISVGGKEGGGSGMAKSANGSPATVAPGATPDGIGLIRRPVRYALLMHVIIVVGAAIVFYPVLGPYWIAAFAVLWSGFGTLLLNNHLAVREAQFAFDRAQAEKVKTNKPRFQPRRSPDAMGVYPTDDEIAYREGTDDDESDD